MTFDRRSANVTDPVVRGLYCPFLHSKSNTKGPAWNHDE